MCCEERIQTTLGDMGDRVSRKQVLGRIVCGILCLAVTVAVPAGRAGIRGKENTPEAWSVLDGCALSSVAWSPAGDQIAFVAASYKDDSDTGQARASIWTASSLGQGQVAGLSRLAVLTRKEGIPAALFWLESGRVGWAASRASDYVFMLVGLTDSKPRRLIGQAFRGVQGTGDSGLFEAPDDVNYDRNSRTLLFSGSLTSMVAYVRVLPLSTGRVRDLIVPHPKGVRYPGGYVSDVTLCGSLTNPKRPLFYMAANIMADETGKSQLWRSDSYSLVQDKVIAAGESGVFPRLSPDGRVLAYLETGGPGKPDKLTLYDLQSAKHRVLASLAPVWKDLAPAIGCPYSWSPDGKKIAYADGSRIKIISVTAP